MRAIIQYSIKMFAQYISWKDRFTHVYFTFCGEFCKQKDVLKRKFNAHTNIKIMLIHANKPTFL
jgi:hypothetical protein